MESYGCKKNGRQKSLFLTLVLAVLPVVFGGCAWMKERALRDYTQAHIRSTPLVVPAGRAWTNESVTPLVVAAVDVHQQAQAKPLITLPLVTLPSVHEPEVPRPTGAFCLQVIDDAKLAYLKIPGLRVLDVFYELVERLSTSRWWRIINKDELRGRITLAWLSDLDPAAGLYVLVIEKKDDSTRVVVSNGGHDPYNAKKVKSVLAALAQLIGKPCSDV